MPAQSRSLRRLRYYLALSCVPILAWVGHLSARAAAQLQETDRISATIISGIIAGLAAVAVTPLAWRALGRFERRARFDGARPFSSVVAYYRVVALAFGVLWLFLIFGTRKELSARFASHILWGLALHRLCLCFPEILQRGIATLGARRSLRVAELVLTNLLVTAVAAEFALRVYFAAQGGPFWMPDQTDPFGNKQSTPIFGAAPNSLGYNDREFEREKAPQAFRIAAVGDSFFVGHVPRAFGVVARTEALLREAAPERAIEVYNFGIVATSVHEYVEVVRREALAFAPDAVVAGIYVGNDIRQSYRIPTPLEKRWYALFNVADRFERGVRARRATASGEFVDLTRIADTSASFWESREKVPRVQSEAKYLEIAARHLEACRPSATALREEEWRDTLGALAELQEACDRARVRLFVVLHPDHVQVSERLRKEIAAQSGAALTEEELVYPQTRILAFCAERGIRCLDLLPAFRGRPADPDHLYLAGDNHWSAAGNECAARAIAAWLLERL